MAYASRRPSYLITGLGTFLQAVASWWRLVSLSLFGITHSVWYMVDLMLYSATALTFFGVWHGLRPSSGQRTPLLSSVRFVNLAGLKLAALGCVIEVFAMGCGEILRNVNGGGAVTSLAYMLLTFGVLTGNLGVVVGLTIEYGMIQREFVIVSRTARVAVFFSIFLVFSAIWLAASGAFIYLGASSRSPLLNWMAAFALAFVGTLVLVPLKRVMPGVGSGVCISAVFNAVACLFLVVYDEYPVYAPWGILPVLLFELVLIVVGSAAGFKRAVLLSSLLAGALFGAVYYPFTVHIFPWAFSLRPLIFFPLAGSAVGALIGNRVYTVISSAVLDGVRVL